MDLSLTIGSNVIAYPPSSGGAGLVMDGALVPGTRLQRGDDFVFKSPNETIPVESIPEKSIFAGYAVGHFGHFLLDGLSRVWLIKQYPDIPIFWLCAAGQTGYSSFQSSLLRILDIGNPAVFLNAPTQIAEALVPDAGYISPRYFAQEQADALAVWSRPTVRRQRVWLSRTALIDRGGITNEDVVEDLLQRKGWRIVRPETMPLSEQLDILAESEHVAGVEGSAFHLLMLLKEPKCRITIIARRERVTPNLDTIASVCGISQRIIYSETEVIDEDLEKRRALQRVRLLSPKKVFRQIIEAV